MEGSRIDALEPFTAKGAVNVIIETPQGTANKLKWDPAAGLFKLSQALCAGPKQISSPAYPG